MNETFATDIDPTEIPASDIPDLAVLKFGGTSLADASRLRHVAAIVRAARAHSPVVVVVSAMAGVTDALIATVDAAGRGEGRWRSLFVTLERRHLSTMQALSDPREWLDQWWALRARLGELHRTLAEVEAARGCGGATRAHVVAGGERLSASLTVAALRAAGCDAVAVDATELIATDTAHAEAAVDAATTRERARRRLARVLPRTVPVVTGFLAAGPDGRTTLLGRGGSDYSAAVLGAALDADRVEIWTDVPGVLSAPPRWVPGARTVPNLATAEASALARWGGKVLHPRTLEPLAPRNIPVVVADAFAPDAPATTITGARPGRAWRAVVGRGGLIWLERDGGDVGPALAAAAVPFWPVETGEPGAAVLVASSDAPRALAALGRGGRCRSDLAMAVLVGRGGEADARVRSVLRERRLPTLGVVPRLDGAGLGLVVREHHLRRTVKVLHDELVAPAGATVPTPAAGALPEVSR